MVVKQGLKKYFPKFTNVQIEQFEMLAKSLTEWNAKINVISRKDVDNIFLHHILHSLAIAKYLQFLPGAKILDLGTGGGFPGLPLAIVFPETEFVLLDSRQKKLFVIEKVSEAAGIKNIKTIHSRVEEHKSKYDFVVTRAVAKAVRLFQWSEHLIKEESMHVLPNGILALKGGDLKLELKEVSKRTYSEQIPLSQYYEEAFYESKSLIYLQH